jgi:hypothetical protein
MPTLILALTIIALVIGLFAGWSAAHILAYLRKTDQRLSDLEKTIQDQQASQAKHLPYKTADEIENATAALLKLKFETDFRTEMIDNALSHFQMARSGNGKNEK